MTEERARLLAREFTALLRGAAALPEPPWHFECDDGWFELIRDLLRDLDALRRTTVPSLRVAQIKEKYGGLRCYVEFEEEVDEDPTEAPIRRAEARSFATCEACGATGGVTTAAHRGWIQSLCPRCRAART